jgi:hypothetical protein
VRRRHVEPVVVASARVGRRLEQPADLRGDRIVVARTAGEGGAEPALGQAEPVVRSGVEVPDAAVPRRVDRGMRFVVADRAVQVAELGAAEGKLCERNGRTRRAAERNAQRQYSPGRDASSSSRIGAT